MILKYVWLNVISGAECQERIREYKRKNPKLRGEYHDNTICTWETNEDTCAGDSGGPLVKKWNGYLVLVGLTSWGPKHCGESEVVTE